MSFPQNKYILHIINLNAGQREKCADHDRELALLCTNSLCKVPICPKCYVGAHNGHSVIDLDEYYAGKIRNLHEHANSVIATIETGIDKLDKLRVQKDKESDEVLTKLRKDQNDIEQFFEKALGMIKKRKSAALKAKEFNDQVIQGKIEYLKEQRKAVKDIKKAPNLATKAEHNHDMINNIETNLTSMFNHTFKLETTTYQQNLDLTNIQKMAEDLGKSVTVKASNCDVMKDCLDALGNKKKTSKRKVMRIMRKQTSRSLSLSYQKKDGRGRAHPSFGMTPTFQTLTLLTS